MKVYHIKSSLNTWSVMECLKDFSTSIIHCNIFHWMALPHGDIHYQPPATKLLGGELNDGYRAALRSMGQINLQLNTISLPLMSLSLSPWKQIYVKALLVPWCFASCPPPLSVMTDIQNNHCAGRTKTRRKVNFN